MARIKGTEPIKTLFGGTGDGSLSGNGLHGASVDRVFQVERGMK